ncbi:MAG: VWA domain-containing protein, partial [bacterium]|nr:VWA domain-containing protein [bacterium]
MPLESFVDRVDVEIVNVEVFVTDRKERRVTGLVREDFELYEDGRPVEITNFYAVEPTTGEAEPSPDAAAAGASRAVLEPQRTPEEQKLSLMVFFDQVNIRPNHRVPVLKALGEFLDERLAHRDRVMLAAWSGGGIEVIQSFTEDRRLIAQGIRRIGRTATQLPAQQITSHLALRWGEMDRLARNYDAAGVHSVGLGQEAAMTVRRATATIEDAASLLGGQPGRKAILYVSDGLPKRGIRRSTRHLLRQVPRTANAHLVTVYALNAKAVGTGTISAVYDKIEAGSGPRSNAGDWAVEEPLLMMSAPTGGALLSSSANFPGLLRRLGEDFDSFYSLGYASRSPGDGKYHTIEVKLRRRGLSARHRTGYLEKPPAERVADRLLASLGVVPRSNPLGIQLAFGQADKSGSKQYELPILVKIPSGVVTFLRRDEVMESRLRIYL